MRYFDEVRFAAVCDPEIDAAQNAHEAARCRAVRKREMDAKYKERERIKNASYQKMCDQYKRRMRRKGNGRKKKVKGEVLPTSLPCNDSATKSWRCIGYGQMAPLHEGFKHFAIWDRT